MHASPLVEALLLLRKVNVTMGDAIGRPPLPQPNMLYDEGIVALHYTQRQTRFRKTHTFIYVG